MDIAATSAHCSSPTSSPPCARSAKSPNGADSEDEDASNVWIRRFAAQLRRLPMELVRSIMFEWSRRSQPQPLLRDIEHFGHSLQIVSETYEGYWVSMSMFSQHEALCWLENDLFRFMNKDRPMMRGLTRQFYAMMLRLRCFRGSRALVDDTFGTQTWMRKWRGRAVAHDMPLKVVFLWGVMMPADRDEFINVFGVARRRAQLYFT